MISFSKFSKKYESYLFQNINLNLFEDSDLVIIRGGSGTGKTTISNILLGLDTEYEGKVSINGKNLKSIEYNYLRRNIITNVFQDNSLLTDLTVLQNLKILTASNTRNIYKKLRNFQMYEQRNKKFKDLSGGQKQRIAIIRAMLTDTEFIIFDEPTANLDAENMRIFEELIKKTGKKVLIITHDDRFSAKYYSTFELCKGELSKISSPTYSTTNNNEYSTKNFNTKDFNYYQIIKYNLDTTLSNPIRIFFNNFSLFFIIFLFIIMNGFLINSVIEVRDVLYNGMSQNAIVLDLQNLSKEFKKNNPDSVTNGENIYFSDLDVEKFKNLEGVKETYLFQDLITSAGVTVNGNSFISENIMNKEEYVDKITTKDLISSPESITIEFSSIPLKSEHMNNYSSYVNEDVLYGAYPKDGEVMIPDIYADYISEDNQYENLIGSEHKLFLKDGTASITQKFKISGIYKTNYYNALETRYIIYTPKSIDPELSYEVDSMNYGTEIFKNEEEWNSIVGTGYSKILILTESDSIIDVENSINNIFPNNTLISRNSINNGEYGMSVRKVITSNIKYYMVMLIIFIITIYITNKSLFETKKRNYALLYSCGYKHIILSVGLIFESLVTNLMILSLSYLIIFMMSFIPLLPPQIQIIMLFTLKGSAVMTAVLFIIILTVIISIFEIKRLSIKSLLNFLKS